MGSVDLRWTSHPVMVTIRETVVCIRVALPSYETAVKKGGPHTAEP